MEVKVYNQNGEVIGSEKLSAEMFEVPLNIDLVSQVAKVQEANRRQVLANTLGRSEVRGGGKKPWKQKGTGRARHGSIRSPLWVGGGITFGPTKDRNFSLNINKKMKRKALKMVLSDKAKTDALIVVDSLKLETGKTKNIATMLTKFPMKKKSALIVYGNKNEHIVKGARNIPKVTSENVQNLNVLDLLKYQYMIIEKDALSLIGKPLVTKEEQS